MNIIILFYISWDMNYSIEEKKEILQSIINKHLKKGESFSVKNFDEETIDLLIIYLLQKDEVKKKEIREKILIKSKNASYELESQFFEVESLAEKIETIPSFREALEEQDCIINSDCSLQKLKTEINL